MRRPKVPQVLRAIMTACTSGPAPPPAPLPPGHHCPPLLATAAAVGWSTYDPGVGSPLLVAFHQRLCAGTSCFTTSLAATGSAPATVLACSHARQP